MLWYDIIWGRTLLQPPVPIKKKLPQTPGWCKTKMRSVKRRTKEETFLGPDPTPGWLKDGLGRVHGFESSLGPT